MEKMYYLRELAEVMATRQKPVSAWLKELRDAATAGRLETIQRGESVNAPHLATMPALQQYMRRHYRLNEVRRAG